MHLLTDVLANTCNNKYAGAAGVGGRWQVAMMTRMTRMTRMTTPLHSTPLHSTPIPASILTCAA